MGQLSRLELLGFNTWFASDEQIAVIESLSDAEIELLASIKRRFEDAEGDVEGHSMDGGGIVW